MVGVEPAILQQGVGAPESPPHFVQSRAKAKCAQSISRKMSFNVRFKWPLRMTEERSTIMGEMRRMTRRLICITHLLIVIVTGCTPRPLTDMRDSSFGKDEYRYELIERISQRQLSDTFLAVTFSGGGMRAAALAYGALRAIQDTTLNISAPGEDEAQQSVPLIEEIDFVSSVSGGSITAAHWALHGPTKLEDLEDQFLRKNIQGQLLAKLLSPISWFLLPTPRYSRIGMLSENIDKNITKSKTYGDLN